ncbi:MAG: hypothetical protein SGCHY_000142 [Lobulomycetales sp.]
MAAANESSGSPTTPSAKSAKPTKPSEPSFTKKDIWTLVKERKAALAKKPGGEKELIPQESNVLIVGNKYGGKSSLLARFLDRSETKSATIALEYSFCRKSRGSGVSQVKDIAHIWELAGGIDLSELLTQPSGGPVNEASVSSLTLCIVVDLSRSRIEQILKNLEARGSKRPKALRAQAWRKYGNDHPDKASLNPMLLPVLIVGNKYDLFRQLEPEKQKLICKTLRYIAHTTGSHLLFTGSGEESAAMRFRQLLSHHAFRSGSTPKVANFDHGKPVFIIAGYIIFFLLTASTGQDSLSGIGNPPSVRSGTLGKKVADGVTLDVWKQDFEKYFPATGQEAKSQAPAAFEIDKYPEPAIDDMRAQKSEELVKQRKNNERREKEQALAPQGSDKRSSVTSYSRSKAAAAR